MKAAILTPVHRSGLPYLGEAGRSIVAQIGVELMDMCWVIVPNGGVTREEIDAQLRSCPVRVVVVPGEEHTWNIGALKHAGGMVAAELAGCIIELDCDDLLEPDAVKEVLSAFTRHGARMVYSDCVHFDEEKQVQPYNQLYGWVSYSHDSEALPHHPYQLFANRSWPVRAGTVSRMIFAPDHLRAWDSATYKELKGHDADLPVADDLDLTQRIFLNYGASAFSQIKRPLYLYRRHSDQRTSELPTITSASLELQRKRILDLFVKEAHEEQNHAIDLGCGPEPYRTMEAVDLRHGDDLSKTWAYADQTVGVARAFHVFEHLPDRIHTMTELHRVLVHGGLAVIEVPCALGAGAFQDPTHVSYWVRESFAYYTDMEFAKYLPHPRPTFQLVDIFERALSLSGTLKGRTVPVIQAHLRAIHNGDGCERLPGPIHI